MRHFYDRNLRKGKGAAVPGGAPDIDRIAAEGMRFPPQQEPGGFTIDQAVLDSRCFSATVDTPASRTRPHSSRKGLAHAERTAQHPRDLG
uniref:Uncharacterized protein n=1 Tax=Mycobacterium sp. (strain JLS) TaxID=164757 RepID=A0A5Q5CLG9_MYCSJ